MIYFFQYGSFGGSVYADVVDYEEEKEENEDRGKYLGGQEFRLVEEDS